MRGNGGGYRRVAHIVVALVVTALAPFVASSPASAASTCAYNALPAPVAGVTPGTVVTVACTGLAPSQSVTIDEESPLAFIVQPATSAPLEAGLGLAITATADASGSLVVDYTVPLAFTAGDPAATCPPTQAQVNAGLATCSITLRDQSTSALLVAPANLVYVGQPTPQVTPTVNIVNGGSFVAGDIVTFAGSGFWGSADGSPPVVSFGATVAAPLPSSPVSITPTTYVCALDCNGFAGTLTSGGVVSGSVVVPSGLASGVTPVSVVQVNATPFPGNGPLGSVAAGTQTNILGAPNATASPNNGGAGTPVQVTGTGWDPQGAPPALTFLTPATVGGQPSTATGFVDGNGNLSGVITVTGADALGVNPIVVTQGALSAQAAYTVTDVTTLCVGTSCTTNQVLTQTIGQGDLMLSEQSFTVTLSPIVLNGAAQHGTGQLNAITVTDDRGTLVGWTVTGTLQGDFLNQNSVGNTVNNSIPASNLSWVPAVALAAPGSGVLSQVAAGPASALSKTVGITLCSAAPGGGGGGYTCTAALDFLIPASVAAGTYTAVLNLTIT